jgi:DNA-binding protein HU-beta
MNKTELVNAIAAESGLSKVDSKKALDALISSVSATLKSGDKVTLVGFGTFSVVLRSARTGINPSTQKPIQIPAKKVVKFKAGSELSDSIE